MIVLISFVGIALLVGIDQLIKCLVTSTMQLDEIIKVIKIGKTDIFNLHYILNDGAGWGILGGKTSILIILTSVFLAIVIIYMFVCKQKTTMLYISLTLIVSGGIGNLIDRIFNEGKVVDYIEAAFINFPIFNFADICVVIGALLLILYVLFFEKKINKKDSINFKVRMHG